MRFVAMASIVLGLFVSAQAWAKAIDPIPKKQFREQFESGMLQGFCRESKFTSQCYEMDVGTCEANVKSSLAKCLRDQPLPEEVAKAASAQLGIKIGRCIGTDFQARNKSKLRKITECQNPIEWLGK